MTEGTLLERKSTIPPRGSAREEYCRTHGTLLGWQHATPLLEDDATEDEDAINDDEGPAGGCV